MNILIADDDFISRKILGKAVAGLGEVDVACNGSEAWSAASSALQVGRPYGLILLDIQMPGMDGHELLRKLRSLEAQLGRSGHDRTRVAMASALGDSANVIGSFREECDGFIRKPYSRESVLEDLKKFDIL